MKTPRWLMAGALLFWGWESGLILWSVGMALALEASSFTVARWDFKDSDLDRIGDLCWISLMGAAFILLLTEDRLLFIFKFTQWLPFCFFPAILAQVYGNRDAIPVSAFYWVFRRGRQSSHAFHISFAYFTVCIAAASASPRPNGFFYMGVALLILLALASIRPRHVSLLLWVLLATLVIWTGQAGHQRLRRWQNTLEVALGSWLAEFFDKSPDMYECRTRIGQIGTISTSRKVLLRVRVPYGQIPPNLLRQGAFDTYTNQTWYARSNNFAPVPPRGPKSLFHLLPPKRTSAEIEIASYFESGKGPLVLPHGIYEIDGLAASLRTNDLGVCSIEGGPGLVVLQAHYGGGLSMDGPPGPMDTYVPNVEKPGLEERAAELKLADLPERLKIRAISQSFRDHFVYSLIIPPHRFRGNRMTELGWFLKEGRSGHCEYFATAAVLLLREAGIPARYITGYAVPESARHGDTYLVRECHQHAWALVYHSDTGIWEQIDTTPSNRDEAEAKPLWWESVSDFLSTLIFDFSKWRWSKTSLARGAEWLLALMILSLVWRIFSAQQRQRAARSPLADRSLPAWPGLDSELYLIHQRLAGGRFERRPNEPLAEWQRRLQNAWPAFPALDRVFHLHRRFRFDPHGLAASDRQVLKAEVEAWLAAFAGAAPALDIDLHTEGGV